MNDSFPFPGDPLGSGPVAVGGFPQPFGPYTLLGSFGRGGMGEVYLARRQALEGIEKLCVLKILRGDLAESREYVVRFLDEARVVIQLHHAKICQVFDVGRVGDVHYLAMEYISGVHLRALLDRLSSRGQVLPPALAVYIACEMLEGLDAAHRHEDPATGQPMQIVHRDVSPQNVMVSFQGEVKLIDFGLAQSAVKQEVTESQVVMGKIAYMAPEHARGDEVGPAADQFAAAIVLYELLTGARFYGLHRTHEIWELAGRGGFAPDRLSSFDPEVRDALTRALAKNPQDRFPTCEDFRAALLIWLNRNHPGTTSRPLRELLQHLFQMEIDGARSMSRPHAATAPSTELVLGEGPPPSNDFISGSVPLALMLPPPVTDPGSEPTMSSRLVVLGADAPTPASRAPLVAGLIAGVAVVALGGAWLALRATSTGDTPVVGAPPTPAAIDVASTTTPTPVAPVTAEPVREPSVADPPAPAHATPGAAEAPAPADASPPPANVDDKPSPRRVSPSSRRTGRRTAHAAPDERSTTKPAAKAAPRASAESFESKWRRLERCPNRCAKSALDGQSLAKLKKDGKADAFFRLFANCLDQCP